MKSWGRWIRAESVTLYDRCFSDEMSLVVTVLQSKVLNSVNREKNWGAGMMLIQRHHTTLYSPRMLSSGDSYLK